jgi:hypothetical protein
MHRLLDSALTIGLMAAFLVSPGVASAATPTPMPTPCQAPDRYTFTASAAKVDSGQSVTLTVTYYQCGGGSEHHFTVSARPQGQSAPTAVGQLVTAGQPEASASLTVTLERSTTYYATQDGQTYSQPPSVFVDVDRTGGSCEGVVTLAAPSAVRLGDDVLLTGQRSDTSTVTIKVRERARTAFTGLTTSRPDASGRFAASYQANDDYAAYASGDRCDSATRLLQIQPTISGPATVRRGQSVSLTVTGLPTAPVALYFHKAGTTGYVNRRLSSLGKAGIYTTSYVADADYRYYAVVGNDHRASNIGLTQTS